MWGRGFGPARRASARRRPGQNLPQNGKTPKCRLQGEALPHREGLKKIIDIWSYSCDLFFPASPINVRYRLRP
jgi:hypothetical protein